MLHILDKLMAIVAGALIATTAIVTCVSVFFRFIGAPLAWPVELTGYLLIWISFAGAYLALRGQGHIAFDVLVDGLPKGMRKSVFTLADIIVGIFLVVLTWFSYKMISIVGGAPLETLDLPRGLFMAAIPITSVAMILGLLDNIINRWRNDA